MCALVTGVQTCALPFSENALLFVDESHVTIGQVNGMSRGDHRRKLTLAEYGFRLPSAIDNRPLRSNEWDAMRPQSVFVSASPGSWEMEQTSGVCTERSADRTSELQSLMRSTYAVYRLNKKQTDILST